MFGSCGSVGKLLYHLAVGRKIEPLERQTSHLVSEGWTKRFLWHGRVLWFDPILEKGNLAQEVTSGCDREINR